MYQSIRVHSLSRLLTFLTPELQIWVIITGEDEASVVPMYTDKPGLGKRHAKTDMGRISELSEELLVKIVSFLPTKEAVSTSILSKQWKFLWRWGPKLEYDIDDFESKLAFCEYMNKNLPLHKAPVIEKFSRELGYVSVQPEDIKMWAGIAVSRCVCKLTIRYSSFKPGSSLFLPTSLYTCEPLVTLILTGKKVFVDVPPVVTFPSLKTLELRHVTYSNEDSLRLLISYCLVLEDLVIERYKDDNLSTLVVTAPLLQRLSLYVTDECSPGGYEIVTPSLKYFNFEDNRYGVSYLTDHMPKLEEADIRAVDGVEKFLESITSVKSLSLNAYFNSGQESLYPVDIEFNQLEHLTLCIDDYHWPQLLVRFLEYCPKLRDLHIYSEGNQSYHAPFSWDDISVPKCLVESLESFKFEGYQTTLEERDVLCFLFKNARRLKSSSISSSRW